MFTRTEQMLSPLALVDIANDFVGRKKTESNCLNDIPNKFSISSVSTNGKLETKQEVLYTTVVI